MCTHFLCVSLSEFSLFCCFYDCRKFQVCIHTSFKHVLIGFEHPHCPAHHSSESRATLAESTSADQASWVWISGDGSIPVRAPRRSASRIRNDGSSTAAWWNRNSTAERRPSLFRPTLRKTLPCSTDGGLSIKPSMMGWRELWVKSTTDRDSSGTRLGAGGTVWSRFAVESFTRKMTDSRTSYWKHRYLSMSV